MNIAVLLNRITKLSFAAVLLAVSLSGWGGSSGVLAQGIGNSWTQPINLSASGAASDPRLVIDSQGVMHVLWIDRVAGLVYTAGTGTEWSPPAVVTLPFELIIPVLAADSGDQIYAFWLDEEATLFASQVRSDLFASGASWTTPQRLGTSVVALDAAADSAGRMHISYIQILETEGAPAGIYYRQSASNSASWTTPTLLYQSTYFRSLDPQTAHLRIATSEQDAAQRVFVAWDNRARERVFIARSVDGGTSWDAPQEIDSPTDGSVQGGPASITVGAQGSNILLLWQNNQTTSTCTQFYQWSFDGGDTWQPRGRLLEDVPGCPESNEILTNDGSYVYLHTLINQQSYLLAWDGTRWSSPQPQSDLNNFTDTDTFKPIQLECRQAGMVGPDRIFVVGCDKSGQDIWVTSRGLENVLGWFSDAPLWEGPHVVASTGYAVKAPFMIGDADNRIHVLWSEPDETLENGPGRAIYHARYENGQWSAAEVILSSTEGVSEAPAAALDRSGNLLVVWSGGLSGEIYFSRANAGRAVIASSWEEPMLLPSPAQSGSSPAITVDQSGKIYVVYAIPLNESRGIYLVSSTDEGMSWSEPVTIFDAAGSGWAMVDDPQVAVTANGHVYVSWIHSSLPSGVGPLGMAYSHSPDGGVTWSGPEVVVDKPVLWHYLVGIGERTIHRLWQEISNGRTTLWHERSDDSGSTWTRISPVSIFGDTVGAPAVTVDYAGRLHLLQIVDRGSAGYAIQHWIWDGQTWENSQSQDLQDLGAREVGSLGAAIAPDGRLGISFNGITRDSFTGTERENLYFSSRVLQVPGEQPTPLPPLPATPTPATTPTPESQPTPTPGAGAGTQNDDFFNSPGASSSSLNSIIGPLAAGLIVVIVFFFSLRSYNSGRTRRRTR